MGTEGDHHLHKTEEAYLRNTAKTPGDFDYSAHTPTLHNSQDTLEAVDRRDLSPWLLPTAARKNWAWEQRSETLQAPQKPEAESWRMEGETDARCRKMQDAEQTDEHM